MSRAIAPVLTLEDRHHWRPSPRQAEVLEKIAELPEEHYLFLGYGGAAGGGKTNLLAEGALEIALQCPGSKQLVGRNHMVDLETTTLAEFDRICPPHLLYKKYDSVPVYRQVRMPHWPAGVVSTIYFRQVSDAENRIGSEEFSWIWLEEAHEIDKRDILYLFGRLRHRPEKKRGIVCGFNPFPSFVTDVFMNGTETLIDPEDEEAADLAEVLHTVFVPALVQDNPHLPPNYAAMMRLAWSDDPYYLDVLLRGKAGVVPNSVYGLWLNNPLYVQQLQVQKRPKDLRFTRAVAGWDWGTTKAHKAAGALTALDSEGRAWTIDSWESSLGSSDQLVSVGEGWLQWCEIEQIPCTAAYDKSQGSLDDALAKVFALVVPGVRDVEGRIREGRGLVSKFNAPFAWWKPGAREVWRYLGLYHRDDHDEIVEVLDDIPDAWHYSIYELLNPSAAASRGVTSQAVGYKPPTSSAARSSLIRIRRRGR